MESLIVRLNLNIINIFNKLELLELANFLQLKSKCKTVKNPNRKGNQY